MVNIVRRNLRVLVQPTLQVVAFKELMDNAKHAGYRRVALALALTLTFIPCAPVSTLQVQASDFFEAGWLVVKAKWFKLSTTSPRL